MTTNQMCARCKTNEATVAVGAELPTGLPITVVLCKADAEALAGQPMDVILAACVSEDVMRTRIAFMSLMAENYTQREIAMMQHPSYISKMILDQDS